MSSIRTLLLRRYIVFLFFLPFIISCKSNEKETAAKKEGTPYRIELFGKNNSGTINLDTFIRNPSFVQLDIVSSENNSFIAVPKKIITKDGKYFIADGKYVGLKVFDTAGHFIRIIGKVGEGPGEYTKISDFQIRGDKLLLLADNMKIIEYSLDGKYLATKRVDLFASAFGTTTADNYVFYTNYNVSEKSRNNNIVVTDSQFKVTKHLFPFPDKTEIPSFDFTGLLSQQGNNLLYSEPFDNIIYNIDSASVSHPLYTIDFGKRFMPAELKTDMQRFVKEGMAYSFLAPGIIEYGDRLFFSYKDEENRISPGVFTKSTQKLITKSCYSESFLNYLFTVPDGVIGDNRFVIILKPERIIYLQEDKKFMKLLAESGSGLYPIIRDFKETDNPVLFCFSL